MAVSLDGVYEEYISKFGTNVDATKFSNYIRRNHQAQWKYKDIKNFLNSKQNAVSSTNNNVNSNTNTTKLTVPIANRYGSRRAQSQLNNNGNNNNNDKPTRRARGSVSIT